MGETGEQPRVAVVTRAVANIEVRDVIVLDGERRYRWSIEAGTVAAEIEAEHLEHLLAFLAGEDDAS